MQNIANRAITTIVFETHAASLDNEAGIASGHLDVDLSPLGRQQAQELGERYANVAVASVVCSDLRRSFRTAEIAFGSSGVPILRDRRLRECDYGDLTGYPVDIMERERSGRLHHPFPNGESYSQAMERVRALLVELVDGYAGQIVLIVGHRATFYSLEHLLGGLQLLPAIEAPWIWQPGWTYQVKGSLIPSASSEEKHPTSSRSVPAPPARSGR